MVFFRCMHVLGDAAAQKIGFGFNGERRKCVVGGGLQRRGRGWKKRFGVGGKVVGAVGGIKAFGEHDEGGAGTGGF